MTLGDALRCPYLIPLMPITFSEKLQEAYRTRPDQVAINMLLAGKPDQPLTYC